MWHDTVGVCAAIVLTAIGALHIAWGFSPWPARDYDTLRRFVVGRPTLPSRTACVTVGTGLVAASYGVLAIVGALPEVGPSWLYTLGIWVLTGALLLRGTAGAHFSNGADREFARWNLIAYSPLCAALGLCALVVAAV